jgi:hypothetical protein
MVKQLLNFLFPKSKGPKSVFELNQIHANLIQNYKTMNYQDYLTTDHWKRVRLEALKAARYTCQLCDAKHTQLNVHHRSYENRGCESLNDLIVLCSNCHKKFHGK